MILAPHIIVGAIIGAKIKKPFLVIILAFLSHFVLDAIPHWDYSITLLNVIIDVPIGLLIVFLAVRSKNMFNKNYLPYIALGIFASLLPDALWWISSLTNSRILDIYTQSIHHKIHYLPQKEGVLTFLGLSTQIVIVVISLLALFSF